MTDGASRWFRAYHVHLFLLLLLLSTLASTQSNRPSGSKQPNRIPRAKSETNGSEQVLYQFKGVNDGEYTNGSLIFDSSGNLYGTTEYGGGTTCNNGNGNPYDGCGTVFKLSPNSSGSWTETILYSFQGGNDGQNPTGRLIFDSAGNLYGTTSAGGETGCSINGYSGCGTVFELSPSPKGTWSETVLYRFTGDNMNSSNNDGGMPAGSLTFDQKGNLYGATAAGGNFGCGPPGQFCGTIFELSPNGSGGWTENVLYRFNTSLAVGGDGWSPNGELIFDPSGNLYGTTSYGGSGDGCFPSTNGCGTVFQLGANGSGGWTETLLYSFQGTTTDGGFPLAGLILDSLGNLYGTTYHGGTSYCAGCGTVFQLSPNKNGGWAENILHIFESVQGNGDGVNPAASLIFDQSGNLYGTTVHGGSGTGCSNNGCGTVFELSPNGKGGWAETILYNFQSGSNGYWPYVGLIFDNAGHLYGTTSSGGTGCSAVGGCGVAFLVSKASPDFTIAPASGSQASQTISPGQSATFNFSITPSGSFSGTVNLSCKISPAPTSAPTCSMPSSVNVTAGTAASVTVTVNTTAGVTGGTLADVKFPGSPMPIYSLLLLAAGFLLVPRKRNRLVSAVLAMILGFFWAGCGEGNLPSQTKPGTPAGTYTAEITATSSSLTHTTTVTVVVQ